MQKKLIILVCLCAFLGITVTSLKAQSRTSRIQELLRGRENLPHSVNKLYKTQGTNSSSTLPDKVMGSSKYLSVYNTMNTGSNPLTAVVNDIYKLSSGKFVVLSGSYAFVWDGNTNWQRIHGLQGSPNVVDEDTTNHHIWIGATDGVYEFDSQFMLIKKYDVTDITGQLLAVNSITVDSKDSVWVGADTYSINNSDGTVSYKGGGIYLINGQVTQVLDTLIAGKVTNIKAMSDGTIWIAGTRTAADNTYRLGVYDPVADTAHVFSMNKGTLPRNGIYGLSEDSKGNKWIGLYDVQGSKGARVGKYDGTTWTFYGQSDGVPYGYSYSLSVLSDDSIYYSSADSTVKFDGTKWNLISNGNQKFPLQEVTSVVKGNNGDVLFSAGSWYYLTGGGIHVFDGTNWKFISSYNDGGLFSNYIFGSTMDHNGNLWVSGFFGVGEYNGTSWKYYNTTDGLAENYNWRLLTAYDGTIWLSGSGSSISDTNMVTSYKNGTFTKHDLGNMFHESLFEDHNGNMWFGSYVGRGVAKYDGSKVTVFNKSDGVNFDDVEGIGEDAKGNIYLGGINWNSWTPVIKYDGTNWTPVNVMGSTNYDAYALASDTSGALFVAVNSNDFSGVVAWRDTSFKSYPTYDYIDAITPTGNGSAIFMGQYYHILHDSTMYLLSIHNLGWLYTTTVANDNSIWSGVYPSGLMHYKTLIPIELTSINDYANDQGGWVTLHVNGFLLDPSQFELANQWTVWRLNSSAWESAGSTPITQQDAGQVSVPVPTTMPTGSTSSGYKYLFKVTVENSSGKMVAVSDTMSGFALDNIAPAKVGGVSFVEANGNITVNWTSVNAPDLENYQVFAWNGSNYDKTKPLATTLSTSVTISDNNITSKDLVVVARDIHNNYGQASDPIVVTAISENKSNVPKHFDLKQNYPNPFNPTTTISYDLPKAADVTLEVYNLVGKKVATLVSGTKAAGSYHISFDASHLSSGLYFYRLHAGNFTKVQSMTLIK